MSKREHELNENLSSLRKERECIADSINFLHNSIKLETETIRVLKEQDKNLFCLAELYGNTVKEGLDKLDNSQYSKVLLPLSTAVSLEPMYRNIKEELEKQLSDLTDHNNILVAATPVTYMAKGTASVIVKSSGPLLFPTGESIIKNFDDELTLEKEIEYITNYLNTHFPDIKEDFNHFISSCYAFKTSTASYQEIIGSRTMIFYKLIFPFVKTKYGFEKPRLEAIKKFVFGSNSFISTVQPIIDNAHNLYKELSEQDDTTQSVKLGNITKEYAEDLVIKVVEVLASILKLRENYFIA